jgi:tetratricopeptide (TPR) repeat protein
MKELRIVLAALVIVALTGVYLGCEEEDEIPPQTSQFEWTAMGWGAWSAGDFDDAIRYFGNAIKVDGNYMPAYNGFGWTYMRLQDTEISVDYFEDGILYGAAYANDDPDKRGLYVGLAYALEATDDFVGAISAGNTYLSMDPPPTTPGDTTGGTWVHPHDTRLTAYDAYIILAVCHFAQGNQNRCVDMIHYMQRKINEPDDYEFTTWNHLAEKIEDMIAKDPT